MSLWGGGGFLVCVGGGWGWGGCGGVCGGGGVGGVLGGVGGGGVWGSGDSGISTSLICPLQRLFETQPSLKISGRTDPSATFNRGNCGTDQGMCPVLGSFNHSGFGRGGVGRSELSSAAGTGGDLPFAGGKDVGGSPRILNRHEYGLKYLPTFVYLDGRGCGMGHCGGDDMGENSRREGC